MVVLDVVPYTRAAAPRSSPSSNLAVLDAAATGNGSAIPRPLDLCRARLPAPSTARRRPPWCYPDVSSVLQRKRAKPAPPRPKSSSPSPDIGGCDIQKQEIREAVELPLTHHELYKQIGIDPPRGVLLYGPAGTGKTMLAKAVAHHTAAAFIRVVGSEFVQKYLGEVSCGLCLQCIVIYPAGFSFQKRPAAAATSTMDGA
ncbi:26S protease regulatory subunit 6B [Hordeum vulgare]|nr:26S protease regulatory subunit 6B [Hordeum vulgare]